MGDYDDLDLVEEPEERPARRRDSKIDEAKATLRSFFAERPDEVFYGRQIEVLLEKKFFHWISTKALRELLEEGEILSERFPLQEGSTIRFCFSRRNRYWKRRADQVRKLVLQYSRPEFGRALGRHGETMFDAALPTVGFLPQAKKVRRYQEKVWDFTQHDLDRVFVRDGIPYGTEIKNTLEYIDKKELDTKLLMCRWLGLRPFFIVRQAPKHYVELVPRAGGFTLIFDWQLYPHGALALAQLVRRELGLPVDSPAAIAEGTVKRLLNWHLKQLAGP